MPGEGADPDLVGELPDVGELAEVIDVDEVLGLGQAQLHHRQQRVPAGDDPRLAVVLNQRRDRAVDAGGALVGERSRGLHGAQLLSGDDVAGMPRRGPPTSSDGSYCTGESLTITGERGSALACSSRPSGYSVRAALEP